MWRARTPSLDEEFLALLCLLGEMDLLVKQFLDV